jgi:DNA-binding response OmpR family regulator
MRILLVEDEIKLGRAIKRGLEQDGYAVDFVSTAEDGQAYAETEDYDVIIMDRMLPGGADGLEICRELRAAGNTTPMLMLTALGEVSNRVEGLDGGADDYLVKPFEFDELLARLRALVRRPVQANGPVLTMGDLAIDTTDKRVTRSGQPVRLSKKEYALLEYLAHQGGRVVSKDQIIQHVWDFEADILPNTVEVFVRSLRKKLDAAKGESHIETARGFGYRLRDQV